eukprot:GGOE01041753.1.p1 GENE.GGOE01041753.1~~GGOE01041753.1.p1  ORF type:complete len:1185 (-),score=382.37 GGOE01041753.1:209-3625(-)
MAAAAPKPGRGGEAPSLAILQGTDISAKVRLWATTNCHRELNGLLQTLQQSGEDPAAYAAELLRNPQVGSLKPRIAAVLLLHGEGAPDAPKDTYLLDLLVEKVRRDGLGMGQWLLAEAVTRYSLLGQRTRVDALTQEFVVGQQPAVDVYTALLRHYQRVGDTPQVLAVIQGVHEHVTTDIVWFRTALRTLLEMRAYDAMATVRDKMEADGVQLDTLVMQLLLQGLVAAERPWADIEALWVQMVDRSFVRPGPRVFHVLLSAAWKGKGRDGVDDVLKRMEFLAVPADGAIITFLVQVGLMREAAALWQVYRSSVAAMRAKPLSLRKLQEAFGAANRPDLSAEVSQLRRDLVVQDGTSIHDGLRDLLRQGTAEALAQARELWAQVGARELQANPKLYVVGIEVLGATGSVSLAARLADSIANWTIDIVNALLAVYSAKRRFTRITSLLQTTYQKRLRPNTQTQQLLHALFTSIRPQLHRLVFEDRGLFMWFFAEDQLRMACLNDVVQMLPKLVARMQQHNISVLVAVRSMLHTETDSRCFIRPRCARTLVACCAAEVAAAPAAPMALSAADLLVVADELLVRALEDIESAALSPGEVEALLRDFLLLYRRGGESGRICDALEAFHHVMGTAPQEVATFVALAHSFSETHQWTELQALEEALEVAGLNPPLDWFAALFKAYSHSAPDRLRLLWHDMVVTHRIMPDDQVTALFDQHHGNEGYSWIVAETQSRDPVVCGALLCGLLAAHQRSLALQLWGRMLHDGVLLRPEFDRTLWSAILAASAAAEHADLFGQVEQQMVESGLLCSDDCRLLFKKYRQDPMMLRRLFTTIQSRDMKLDGDVYLDLLRALLSHQADASPINTQFALAVLQEMQSRHVTFNAEALAGLLEDASSSNQLELITPLWACVKTEVEGQRVVLTADLSRACAMAFWKHRLPPLAKELQALLAGSRAPPTISTLNLVLSAYLDSRLLPDAEAVVQMMDQIKVRPNQRTFRLLFRLYSTDQTADRSLQLWQQIRTTLCHAEVYHSAVQSFARHRLPQVLREIWQAIEAHGIRPTADIGNAFLEAWLEAGHLGQCQGVLDWMMAAGLQANPRTVRRMQETKKSNDQLYAVLLDVARQLADANPGPPPSPWPDSADRTAPT